MEERVVYGKFLKVREVVKPFLGRSFKKLEDGECVLNFDSVQIIAGRVSAFSGEETKYYGDGLIVFVSSPRGSRLLYRGGANNCVGRGWGRHAVIGEGLYWELFELAGKKTSLGREEADRQNQFLDSVICGFLPRGEVLPYKFRNGCQDVPALLSEIGSPLERLKMFRRLEGILCDVVRGGGVRGQGCLGDLEGFLSYAGSCGVRSEEARLLFRQKVKEKERNRREAQGLLQKF